jgi:hypothetical protein
MAFQTIVDTVPDNALEDLLARLETEKERFTPAAAEPASSVLLEIYPRLRTHSIGFLDPGPELPVDRVVLRLLQTVTDPVERVAIVERLCSRVESLTGRIRLLELVGRRPNPQFERLIPAADSDRLYQEICREIRRSSAAQIAAERDPLYLMAKALAEDPGDRAGIDVLLEAPGVATALLRSSVTDVRSRTLGTRAERTQNVLRWEALRIVVGENDAISRLVDRAAANARSDDTDLTTAIDLAREYLAQGPPSSMPFSTPPVVLRPAQYSPSTYFSPSLSTGWPALLIRAVTTYEVDPLRVQAADIAGRNFHDRLASTLGSAQSPKLLAAMAEARSLPATVGEWKLDPDATQFSGGAVERLVIGPENSLTSLMRVAVFLDGRTGPTRLITDIYVSPTPGTDSEWAPDQLEEARHLMAAALEMASGPVAEAILREVFAGETTRTK